LIDEEPQRFLNFRDDAHIHMLVTYFNELNAGNKNITLAAYGRSIQDWAKKNHGVYQESFDEVHRFIYREHYRRWVLLLKIWKKYKWIVL